MKRIILLLSILLSTAAATQTKFNTEIAKIKNPEIDMKNVFEVRDVVLIRDVATFSLDSGVICFMKPMNDRIRMAVFKGIGSFNYQPGFDVEVRQLKRMMKKEMITDEFTELILFFNDSTYYDIAPYSNAVNGFSDNKAIIKIAENIIDYEIYKDDIPFSDEIIEILTSRIPTSSFTSIINTKNTGDLKFSINPNEYEEISFYKATWDPLNSKIFELVNMFHSQDHITANLADHNNDKISIDNYKLDVTIHSDLSMTCKAKLGITNRSEDVSWIQMSLSGNLPVRNVMDTDGNKLDYYMTDAIGWIYIKMPSKKKGESYGIILSYEGTFIKRLLNYVLLESSMGWYPNYGYMNYSDFDITYHYPDNYKLVSIGELKEIDENNDVITARWASTRKMRNASFNLGPYYVEEIREKEVIPMDLLYVTTDKHENVANDLMLSYDFFTKLFGPLPYKKLNATELPASHGEAFPGLLHLGTDAFIRGSDEGFWEMFVSHEVSHQWWGIAIDFESYRDQWLSEGFATYSSLMYLQSVLQDNEKFMRALIEYRTSLLETRKSFIADGVELGPLSLGYRNNSESTKGDYSLIVYKKGAWIFHMLRNMFINLNTMNEDAFISILRTTYRNYLNKRISTKQFREIVESISGYDFKWFFEQWVDNHYIPKYTVSSITEKSPTGTYKIKFRIKQENVPSKFTMVIPIKIIFDNDKETIIRTLVTGPVSEFETPAMADKPEKIEFNALESVLCEWDDESWD